MTITDSASPTPNKQTPLMYMIANDWLNNIFINTDFLLQFPPNSEPERRIQRLTLHLNPVAFVVTKLSVDIQEKVFDYFNARWDLERRASWPLHEAVNWTRPRSRDSTPPSTSPFWKPLGALTCRSGSKWGSSIGTPQLNLLLFLMLNINLFFS